MRALHMVRLCLVLMTALVAPTVLSAAPLADDGSTDIGDLLVQARERFDPAAEDAVLLMHEESYHLGLDDRRVHEVHRVVWIRTARAIRNYADLRVPWDSARQTLDVSTLRSWRPADGRWTESGPSAVVETTPFALGRAPDYTNIRETMLLTDGLELPCVLEVRYVIRDIEAWAGGLAGVHAMPQRDPCLISVLELGAPGPSVLHLTTGDVVEPEPEREEASGLLLWRFRSENLEPRPHPLPAVTELPHVAWSSWDDAAAMDRDLSRRFDTAVVLEETGRVAALEASEDARSEVERAEMLAAWVGESTRFVVYDRRWFPAPRPAQRSWETAFAHALDRCVLAAAGLRAAGLHSGLAYRRPPGATAGRRPATTSGFDGPFLWVAGEAFEALYDPATSTMRVADPCLTDGSLWRLGDFTEASVPGTGNRAHLRLDLSWNAEAKEWRGTGMLQAAGALSPYARMVGLEVGRSEKVVAAIADAALAGCDVLGHNLERFTPAAVHVGFGISLEVPERDFLNRVRLVLGGIGEQLNDPLHGAAPLVESERGSTLHVPAPLEFVLELHLTSSDLEVVSVPAGSELSTAVGDFRLEVEQGEELVLRRTLRITEAVIPGPQWPQLRALLLADSAAKNGTVLLE